MLLAVLSSWSAALFSSEPVGSAALPVGPSNKVVAASAAVQNNPVIAAVMEQAKYSRAQKSVPGNYWTPMGALITPFIERKEAGTLLAYTDAELQELLDALVAQIAK